MIDEAFILVTTGGLSPLDAATRAVDVWCPHVSSDVRGSLIDAVFDSVVARMAVNKAANRLAIAINRADYERNQQYAAGLTKRWGFGR